MRCGPSIQIAAMHESGSGPSRHIAPPRTIGRYRGIAKIDTPTSSAKGDAPDPSATLGNDRVESEIRSGAAPPTILARCSSPKRLDVDQFRDHQESHAAHGKRWRFHMASVSIPHHERCPRCGSGLVHIEWHERVNTHEVQDLWHCGNCKNEFVTVVTSDEKGPSVTEITEPFFTSLLV